MIWRTIAAAASGMRLRRLSFEYWKMSPLWKPFAVPTLLPAWVGMEEWQDLEAMIESDWPDLYWIGAAFLLRRALYHVSLLPFADSEPCCDATASDALSDITSEAFSYTSARRLLTSLDVHAMYDKFKDCNLPHHYPQSDEVETETHFVGYLRWLRDDAELAQRVAGAWNAAVERGGADYCKCYCNQCAIANSLALSLDESE